MVLTTIAKPFPPGIHVPCLTWFSDDQHQTMDWDLQRQHLEFLISSGLHGIVLAGSNGEAVALSAEEKTQLVQVARDVADKAGRTRDDLAITLGCTGQSTQAVIADCVAGEQAGADYALILVPSYFHFAMDEAAIIAFFRSVADHSPLPVVIYNFPGVVAGLDTNSDILSVLGAHPNIVGVKLTCGGIGKVARIRAQYNPSEFCALAGQSDWLLPAMTVGGIGSITGVANVFPKTCIALYELSRKGLLKEAMETQLEIAKMEWGFLKGGINGTKWIVAKVRGYPSQSSRCRAPYPRYDDPPKQKWIIDTVTPLQTLENTYSTF